MSLVFVLFFQVARERLTEFPKMSFGWARTVKSLRCSLLQVGEKKSYISSQGWSTISHKTEGRKGRKTLQPFLQLSCCHLCCSGQVPFPPPLPLHSSSDLSPTNLNAEFTDRYLSKFAMRINVGRIKKITILCFVAVAPGYIVNIDIKHYMLLIS